MLSRNVSKKITTIRCVTTKKSAIRGGGSVESRMALLKTQISYKNIYLCGTESGAMAQRAVPWLRERCHGIESGSTAQRAVPWHRARCHGTESGAMAQAVRRRPLIALIRVRFETTPCDICGEQGGTGGEFSPMTSPFPCKCHSANTPQSVIVVKQHA